MSDDAPQVTDLAATVTVQRRVDLAAGRPPAVLPTLTEEQVELTRLTLLTVSRLQGTEQTIVAACQASSEYLQAALAQQQAAAVMPPEGFPPDEAFAVFAGQTLADVIHFYDVGYRITKLAGYAPEQRPSPEILFRALRFGPPVQPYP